MLSNGDLVPYPYQETTIQTVERFGGRACLALEMGLGKTACALWVLQRQNIMSYPAVVICPAPVKYVWEQEAHKFGMRSLVLEGQTPQRLFRLPNLTIINYDILKYWTPTLIKCGFNTLILDECQVTGNRRTHRTKACLQLSRRAKHVLALSGTPLLNRPAEMWPMLNMVRPDLYPSFWRYAHSHCDPTRNPWGGWDFKGASRLDELHEGLTKHLMIRYRKRDVLKDLPEMVRSVVPLQLRDVKQYEQARDEFVTWLKKHHSSRVYSSLRAQEVTQVGYLLRLCAKLKLRSAVDWCNDFLKDTDEKIVIFAIHKKMIEALNRRVDDKHVVIDGSVTGRRRQLAVDQFQKDPKTRVLIGNIRAAGVGITLTTANNVIFTEFPWRPGDLEQAANRCHRIGTTRTVWCYYLASTGTIEQQLIEILQDKQSVISSVLDGGRRDEDLDIFDLLMEKIRTTE